MTGEKVPWRTYDRARLRPGYAHPIGQQDVRSALDSAGLAVDWLSLSGCVEEAWQRHEPVRLLSCRRVGDSEFRKHSDWSLAFQTHLSLNACPATLKAELREVVLDQALPRALSWLASAAERGNAWGASERQIEALWQHPGLTFVEDRFR